MRNMPKKTKQKEVVGWAVLSKDGGIALYQTGLLQISLPAIFQKQRDARQFAKLEENLVVSKIKITPLP